MSPELTVVLCTWNRAALLDDALVALTNQSDAPPHEILVIDNDSTDATRQVVTAHASRNLNIRYAYEARPGLSYARNTGLQLANAPLIAFTDDDVRVGPQWLHMITQAFGRNPDASCVGGPVLPVWPASGVPRWLTERHWAPLGVQDYGPVELRVDHSRPLCLIGANLAFRREALTAIGGFEPSVQRIGDGPGSTEDHECHLRLWQSGRFGIYDPSLQVDAVVTDGRVRKSHHRTWHFGHGRHLARMRLPEIERSRGHVFGAPVHLLRQAARDLREWLPLLLRHDAAGAFERETHLWFTAGFLRERWG